MNYVRRILDKFSLSKSLASVVLLVFLILSLAIFLSLGNIDFIILVLVCILLGERFLYGEAPQFSFSTLRTYQRSISLSDSKKRRFLALSFVEMKVNDNESLHGSDLAETKSRIRKAATILAEHVRSFSVEVDNKTRSIRYAITGWANTAAEACQKAETLAERVLRIIRELHETNACAGIIEGERIRNAFVNIIGGDFEALSRRSNVVLRSKERSNGSSGFLLIRVTEGSIGVVNVRKIIELIRDLEIDVTYVISLKASRAYDESVLIDGTEQSQMWVASSFFVVNGRDASMIREETAMLKNRIEGLTGGGVLRIEHGSTTLDRVGGILLRSLGGKKLLLSNDQLIDHIFTESNLVETPSQL